MIKTPVSIKEIQRIMEKTVRFECGASVEITIYERRDGLIQMSMIADTETDFDKGLGVLNQVPTLTLESTDIDVFEDIPLTYCAYFLVN